jgi:transposase
MFVAGIDAHATYLVVAIVSNDGALVQKPLRIRNRESSRLVELLEAYSPLEVVVEASPAWPWLYDLLQGPKCRFVLAHAKKLRVIAEANYKNDSIDATLLARMRLVNLIPEVYSKPVEQREQATLIRHRTRLVRLRTAAASRIHAELHSLGFCLPRGHLLTAPGREWVRSHAWHLFGPEQQLLVRTHERIIDGLRPMIKSLDRRIQERGDSIPAVALLRTIPGIGPVSRITHHHRDSTDRAISRASEVGELCWTRASILSLGNERPLWAHSGWSQPLASQRLCSSGRDAPAALARQLAIAVLRPAQVPTRLACRSHCDCA